LIRDRSNERQSDFDILPNGSFGELRLLIHGTATMPEIQRIALADKNVDPQTDDNERDLVRH
jgi:hypothetical protein